MVDMDKHACRQLTENGYKNGQWPESYITWEFLTEHPRTMESGYLHIEWNSIPGLYNRKSYLRTLVIEKGEWDHLSDLAQLEHYWEPTQDSDNFHQTLGLCTVPLSLFADPERIMRRFYVFVEELCKSTITTNEPCSPVFKEAQPRPSEQSISLISRIGIFFIVHNVFLLLVIYCCNKASNQIVTRSKDLVFYSWKPLSPEVSRLSPYTHAQQHTQTSRTFYIFAVYRPT